MRALTEQQIVSLLTDVKAYLNITWHDEDTDRKVVNYIKTSVSYLDGIAGMELDYWGDYDFSAIEDVDGDVAEDKMRMSNIGKELLIARCFYLNEKAVDDFDNNYRGLVVMLYNLARVVKKKEAELVKQ